MQVSNYVAVMPYLGHDYSNVLLLLKAVKLWHLWILNSFQISTKKTESKYTSFYSLKPKKTAL